MIRPPFQQNSHNHVTLPLCHTTYAAAGDSSIIGIEDLNTTYSAMDLVSESVQHPSKKCTAEAMSTSAPLEPWISYPGIVEELGVPEKFNSLNVYSKQ